MISLLVILALRAVSCHVAQVEDLPIEVKSTLLKFSAENNIKAVDHLTPIFRRDLDPNYAAYWQMVTDKGDYLVVSSGPRTGDHRIVMQGSLPVPTDLLNFRAKSIGNACAKYFMLAPGGVLMCENEAGRIAATSHDAFIQKIPQGTDESFVERHRFLETSRAILKRHWADVRGNVTAKGIWDSSVVYTDAFQIVFHSTDPVRSKSEAEEGISFGETVRVPVDAGSEMKIKLVSGNSNDLHGQKLLCEVLRLCNIHDPFKIRRSEVKCDELGINYVTITPQMPGHALPKSEISFQVETKPRDGSIYVRRFGLDQRKKNRRQTQPPMAAILDETYFPEYDQHMLTEKHCYVGCGPVSWAMIFGYFDRRSHHDPQKFGTQAQALWRCGPSGNEANDTCVAPARNTDTLKRYTEHLNGIMGTFCIGDQGATPQWQMDDVADYFKGRMAGANPTIEAHHDWILSDVGVYEDKFRDNMIHFIQSGWPTVVGIRVDGVFSQHYPVASRYRHQTTRSRTCNHEATSGGDRCATWRSATVYDMYLHMGWGGSKNGWRTAGMFFAAAAKYDLPKAS